jgi:hypothetical protein
MKWNRQHKHGFIVTYVIYHVLCDVFLRIGVTCSWILTKICVCVCASTLHCKFCEGDHIHFLLNNRDQVCLITSVLLLESRMRCSFWRSFQDGCVRGGCAGGSSHAPSQPCTCGCVPSEVAWHLYQDCKLCKLCNLFTRVERCPMQH